MIAMIRKFILFFLRIFRQIFCCFGRKRTDSNSHDERLEAISVIRNDSRRGNTAVVERDWNSWDDAPRTISEHIEVYRENLVKPKDPEPVNEIDTVTEDLFAELAPKIVKQQKIYLNQGAGGGGDDNQDNFSRLSAGVAAEIPISNELEDWDDDENVRRGPVDGWNEINDQDTKKLIIQTRKEMRTSKQKNFHR